jgi:hypothetical protein
MRSSDERSSYGSLADTYGGEVLDDATLVELGEPDEEQAYEGVVGIVAEETS